MRRLPAILKVLMCLTFACALMLHADDMRGMKVVVRDKTGQQVGLYENSYALVIGVSDYTNGWPDLSGVKKDVAAVKGELEKHGFQVTLVEDPDYDELTKSFTDFINKYGRNANDRLLFYFSGHGHTLKKGYGGEVGYIVPADAPNPNVDLNGFMSKALDMQMIEVYAKRIDSKHALFVFDSCFSGSLFALSKDAPEYISYKTAQPVRQFITSGSGEEQVPDDGLFRGQFIEALEGEADSDKDGYVTGVELGEFLQKNMINYSRGGQHPQYGKLRDPLLDKGDFVLKVQEQRSPLPKTKIGKDGAEMVLIPAGEFQMGSNDGQDDEKPVHTVHLDDFYMDKCEVTNAQYRKFVKVTGYREPTGYGYVNGKWQDGFKPWSDPNFNGDNQPVVCVGWEDAKAYADWAGKRLPTEAEWEKAARGGSTGKKFVWGDSDSPPRGAGNFADESAKRKYPSWTIFEGYNDGYAETAPVGSFSPNGYGLYDMAGNVWEWCSDWYDSGYYAGSPERNPTGPGSGKYRVSRGGSWSNTPGSLRVADRDFDTPSYSNDHSGFRCVSQD